MTDLLRRIYYVLKRYIEGRKQRKWIFLLQKSGVNILKGSYISNDCVFEGKNSIGNDCVLKGVEMGVGSYIGSDGYFERTCIGRYCSIANNVRISAGHHPTSLWVSTHPAFYSKMMETQFGYTHEQVYEEFKFANIEKNKFVCIGNDVWIGAEVTILEGVVIGDGAIIGAKSLVTKSVEPYEIVGGVPAKHIGWRFDESDRAFLMKIKWWEKPEEWIRENALLFSDVRKLRDKYDR